MKHDPIDLELDRLAWMSRHWDDAADALQRKDYAAFDRAMSKFRERSQSPERNPRQAQKAAGLNK